jgi:hypothetical protein
MRGSELCYGSGPMRIDLTLDDPRHRASDARLRERCRVREVLLDFVVGPNQYGSTEVQLQRYFEAFAVAAARRP